MANATITLIDNDTTDEVDIRLEFGPNGSEEDSGAHVLATQAIAHLAEANAQANMSKTQSEEIAQLKNENAILREAAQRPQKHDEEHAQIAWRLAGQLLKQAQEENEECAYWFVSALSKMASTHPRRPVIEVLALARNAMPLAAKQYRQYCADKC